MMTYERTDPVEQFLGLTRFSDRVGEANSLALVKELKKQAWLVTELDDGLPQTKTGGRPRALGSWGCAYAGFVISRQVDIETWMHHGSGHMREFWEACGFAIPPSYSTVYARFTELEEDPKFALHFSKTAGTLIRKARFHSDGMIGRAWIIDGSEADTHAELHHDCPAGKCPHYQSRKRENKRKKLVRRVHERINAAKRSGRTPDPIDVARYNALRKAKRKVSKGHQKISLKEAQSLRHKAAALDPLLDDSCNTTSSKPFTVPTAGGGVRWAKHLMVAGCRYLTYDLDAATRAYENPDGSFKRFWCGYYNHPAVDVTTRIPLAVLVTPANVQEYDSYPALYHEARENLGADPQMIVFDKGYGVSSVYEHNTMRGVGTIAPWRGSKSQPHRVDKPEYDRHGVPRCQHCGGETRYRRFSTGHKEAKRLWAKAKAKAAKTGRKAKKQKVTPRIWFECINQPTGQCAKEQAIACEKNWRMLIPLWRTEENYLALRRLHDNYESVHRHWRDRYSVAGNAVANRPKRFGIGAQQTRASAAMFAEWFLVCLHMNWLGSARRPLPESKTVGAPGAVEKLRKSRRYYGLHGYYGKKAEALGLADPDPPPEKDGDDPPF